MCNQAPSKTLFQLQTCHRHVVRVISKWFRFVWPLYENKKKSKEITYFNALGLANRNQTKPCPGNVSVSVTALTFPNSSVFWLNLQSRSFRSSRWDGCFVTRPLRVRFLTESDEECSIVAPVSPGQFSGPTELNKNLANVPVRKAFFCILAPRKLTELKHCRCFCSSSNLLAPRMRKKLFKRERLLCSLHRIATRRG